MNQKGLIYKYKGQEDKALEIFEDAIKLPNTYGEPYFWIAYIHHGKEDFDKALDLYYVARDSVPVTNSYFIETLVSIGQLEYTHTKDYTKSAEAYSTAIQVDEENYELYYKLIKSYNAAKEYEKAEEVFEKVKTAFEKDKLPPEDMEMAAVPIHQFEWNGQTVTVIRSLVEPKETLDISYNVYLINKDGDKIERRFMVEKTIQLNKKSAKHVLCERDVKSKDHMTYPYGWSSDEIPLDDLEKAVKLILDGKMNYAARSSYGNK